MILYVQVVMTQVFRKHSRPIIIKIINVLKNILKILFIVLLLKKCYLRKIVTGTLRTVARGRYKITQPRHRNFSYKEVDAMHIIIIIYISYSQSICTN